jgi:hypothetical protein
MRVSDSGFRLALLGDAKYWFYVRAWDLLPSEPASGSRTRQVISSFGDGKMFYVAKLHPDEDKQNVLMAGCADKKVYQWDMNTGDLVQVGAPVVLGFRIEVCNLGQGQGGSFLRAYSGMDALGNKERTMWLY